MKAGRQQDAHMVLLWDTRHYPVHVSVCVCVCNILGVCALRHHFIYAHNAAQ